MVDLGELRVDYDAGRLEAATMAADPIAQWWTWFEQARRDDVYEPNAAVLATVDQAGWPQARNVLVKTVDDRGFVFFSNYESSKAAELATNPKATLIFSWLTMQRQVRILCTVAPTPDDESNSYFASRPRGSQLGAWASPQSDLIASPSQLEERIEAVRSRFGDEAITRPPFWGGYVVTPISVEYWQGRPDRLHDRLRYAYQSGGWIIERLAP